MKQIKKFLKAIVTIILIPIVVVKSIIEILILLIIRDIFKIQSEVSKKGIFLNQRNKRI